MFKKFAVAATALTLCTLGGVNGANAVVVDFTDDATSITTDTVGGITYNVSGVPVAPNNSQSHDGTTCMAPLACERDGLGISDDEITTGSEVLSVDFNGALVRLTKLWFLDLFKSDPNDPDPETARVTFFGPDAGVIDFAGVEAIGGGNSGFLMSGVLNLVISGFQVEILAFNDNVGSPDAAFAAFEVSEVPIPGAAVLMLSGLAGFGFASRKKRKTA